MAPAHHRGGLSLVNRWHVQSQSPAAPPAHIRWSFAAHASLNWAVLPFDGGVRGRKLQPDTPGQLPAPPRGRRRLPRRLQRGTPRHRARSHGGAREIQRLAADRSRSAVRHDSGV